MILAAVEKSRLLNGVIHTSMHCKKEDLNTPNCYNLSIPNPGIEIHRLG